MCTTAHHRQPVLVDETFTSCVFNINSRFQCILLVFSTAFRVKSGVSNLLHFFKKTNFLWNAFFYKAFGVILVHLEVDKTTRKF
jgi:hypothetical protein